MASETAREFAAGVARPKRPPPWNDPVLRGVVFQILFVAAVIAAGGFLVHNTLANLERQNIATGFGFLEREAAFGIGESLIAYSPADSYARAFLVGLTNTLYVAGLGIVLATVLGTVMGLARLSSNWLIAKLAQIYVETFRNIPLALQLFFWWGLLRWSAPAPRQAWQPIADPGVQPFGVPSPVVFTKNALPSARRAIRSSTTFLMSTLRESSCASLTIRFPRELIPKYPAPQFSMPYV
jgi:general L-amino acid transport system permease protein